VAGLAAAIALDEDDRAAGSSAWQRPWARRDVYWWTEQELATPAEARTAA
jgi:hypothetical protein